jgi:hypothetical protein
MPVLSDIRVQEAERPLNERQVRFLRARLGTCGGVNGTYPVFYAANAYDGDWTPEMQAWTDTVLAVIEGAEYFKDPADPTAQKPRLGLAKLEWLRGD